MFQKIWKMQHFNPNLIIRGLKSSYFQNNINNSTYVLDYNEINQIGVSILTVYDTFKMYSENNKFNQLYRNDCLTIMSAIYKTHPEEFI